MERAIPKRWAIGREIGLIRSDAQLVITGDELRALTDTQLRLALDTPEIIFARVGADQKRRIVEVLKLSQRTINQGSRLIMTARPTFDNYSSSDQDDGTGYDGRLSPSFIDSRKLRPSVEIGLLVIID